MQTDNGTHLVGGGKSSDIQTVNAANTSIQYIRTKGKFKDDLLIPGPTNAFLRVVVSKYSTFIFFSRTYVPRDVNSVKYAHLFEDGFCFYYYYFLL